MNLALLLAALGSGVYVYMAVWDHNIALAAACYLASRLCIKIVDENRRQK